ncbi:unnamed protein product, partial [Polarella glacialis]
VPLGCQEETQTAASEDTADCRRFLNQHSATSLLEASRTTVPDILDEEEEETVADFAARSAGQCLPARGLFEEESQESERAADTARGTFSRGGTGLTGNIALAARHSVVASAGAFYLFMLRFGYYESRNTATFTHEALFHRWEILATIRKCCQK